jgi:peptidoglycan/LPS O-acetylase OafA/YrhL
MTLSLDAPARPAEQAGTRTSARRDAAVDLARAGCLLVVVLLHALMAGVSVGAGGPELVNAMEGWPWFAPLTWVVQVMPLFFLLGGFSSYTQWNRMRARGAGYGDYLAGRLRRLLVPAGAALAATAVLLSALTLSGVPADLVAVAGFRIGQPLWFLGVYVLCTVAVPPMVALHRRAPLAGLAVPVALAVSVDIVRGATGITAIGFANLAFVWLAVQQLGFWLASGRLDGLSRRSLRLLALGAAGVLAAVCATGAWSFDLLADLNPPTGALLLLAVVQLAVFRLAAPALRRVAARPGVHGAVEWVSARAMTVYLWHMPTLVVLAGALLLTGLPLPAPLEPGWWATRPLWLAAVLAAVVLVVSASGRFETGRRPVGAAVQAHATGGPRAVTAAVCGASGVVLALLAGSAPGAWVVAAALAAVALRILRGSVRTGAATR